MRIVLVSALMLASAAQAEVVFREDFERGANPFGFDSYNDYYDAGPKGNVEGEHAMAGERVKAGAVRGHVWKTVFKDFRNDTYFGHRIHQKADWPISDTVHWAAYVKFGDEPGQPEWATADGYTELGKRSYELKLPDLFPLRPQWRDSRIIGKFRAGHDRDPYSGSFVLYTPDGQNHSPQQEGSFPYFEGGRWYAIEFSVEDRGANDRVRIWIDNDDESEPTYEYEGGDMFSSAGWREGLRFDHGYRNHNVPSERVLYYDDITIANDFIGLEPPRDPRTPQAPTGVSAGD